MRRKHHNKEVTIYGAMGRVKLNHFNVRLADLIVFHLNRDRLQSEDGV